MIKNPLLEDAIFIFEVPSFSINVKNDTPTRNNNLSLRQEPIPSHVSKESKIDKNGNMITHHTTMFTFSISKFTESERITVLSQRNWLTNIRRKPFYTHLQQQCRRTFKKVDHELFV